MVRPLLEMAGKFLIGHDVNPVDAADGREIIEHVLDDRFARDGQQRFGLCQGKRIQPCGVSGGKDDDFQGRESVLMFETIWSVYVVARSLK